MIQTKRCNSFAEIYANNLENTNSVVQFIFYILSKMSIKRGMGKWGDGSFRESTRESCAAQRLFQFELESMRYTMRAINFRSERKGRTRRFTSPLSRVIRARRQRVASMPEIKEPVVERPRDR